MVRLCVDGGDAAAWQALLERAPRESLLRDEWLELSWFAARALGERGEHAAAKAIVAAAAREDAEHGWWAERFAALESA
jgi:hypothetical protein